MKSRYSQILVHIVCSLAFLSIPFLSPPPGARIALSVANPDHLRDILGYILALVFFYLNYYVFLPKYYFTRRYVVYALLCAVSFFFIVFIPNALLPHRRPFGGMESGSALSVLPHIIHNSLRFLVLFFISLVLKMNSTIKKAQRDKLNAEVSFLKAQINPHFLFNTLNSIYSLTLTKSDKAPQAVVKLSGIMRYAISETNADKVPLEKEVAYITNYIELQKLRLTDKVKLSYEITGSTSGKQIAPFLLIPFVENAFKYGVNSEEDSNIRIHIAMSDIGIELKVINNKVYVEKDTAIATGIGLATTGKRLGILYPGKHSLVVNDEADEYQVSLNITLT